ncbi:MAG TPA: choice-of-anchor Q domain-containing protein [Pyrinomonadaceae bacterium]|nr:choice-of-anchor Q domain-containing protein [Pyrinomonadaceae bacterium]
MNHINCLKINNLPLISVMKSTIFFNIIWLAILFTTTISAATITVTNTNDSGGGSLRGAIAAAAFGDTIDFNLTGCPCTIVLSSELNIANKRLLINGPGASQLAISGNNAVRVFRLSNLGSAVTISGVTITNGFTSSTVGGGGIFLERGRLAIFNSVISGNTTTDSGGGIAFQQDTILSIFDSTISNNSAGQGGGISFTNPVGGPTPTFDAALLIQNSNVVNNQAGTRGGGVSATDTTVFRSINSNYSNNRSSRNDMDGGGIFSNSKAEIIGGMINLNDAPGSANGGGSGGGVYNQGIMTLNDVNITANTAKLGGAGIYNSGTLTMTGGSVSGNQSQTFGGGISNVGTLNLNRVNLSSNTATTDGGGIHNKATATIIDSTIDSSQAQRNGGGIYNENPGNLTVKNSTISANRLPLQGGGIFSLNGTVTLANSTFSGNQADEGGGLFFSNGNVSITNCTIAFNSAPDGGGGLFNESSVALINARGSIFAKNTVNSNAPDIQGRVFSKGFNLLGNSSGSTFSLDLFLPDLIGTAAAPLDPLLLPLADNGGFTRTHALQPTSPAIDKGTTGADVKTDQRGLSRFVDSTLAANLPGGDNSDIGAFEFSPTTAANVSVSGRILNAQNQGIKNAKVILIDSGGNLRTVSTGSFGMYKFSEIEIGETYVLLVRSKNFRFTPQIITVNDELTEMNLTEEGGNKSMGNRNK